MKITMSWDEAERILRDSLACVNSEFDIQPGVLIGPTPYGEDEVKAE